MHFFTKAGVVKAVDDVSFRVERGRILGLVGESGSGKSMTGYSILGLVDAPGRIVSGRILLNGTDLTRLDEPAWRKLRGERIAMIFQDPMMTLNPVLRIDTQMIEAVRAHHDVSRGAALETCRGARAGRNRLAGALAQLSHQLSGGMRQRVAIAIASQPSLTSSSLTSRRRPST
jgi:peptide/nickel transport system ATP-binding protein